MNRINWVDTLRGIAMLAILLFHTEVYYADTEIINYNFYVANMLTAFAFVSGYLFANPQQPFGYRKKLTGIVRSLVVPYFAFCTVLALGKSLMHSSGYTVGELLLHVLTGQASWYVSALIIAEIFTATAFVLTRQNKVLLAVTALLCIVFTAVCHNDGTAVACRIPDFWKWEEALLLVPFIILGHFYRLYEPRLQWLNTTAALIAMLAAVIALKYAALSAGCSLCIAPVTVSNYLQFAADMIVSALLLVNISRRFCLQLVTFIGQNSLIVYFLCGAIPFIVTYIFRRIGLHYNGNYFSILLAYVFVVDLTTISTYVISRYIYNPLLKRK